VEFQSAPAFSLFKTFNMPPSIDFPLIAHLG